MYGICTLRHMPVAPAFGTAVGTTRGTPPASAAAPASAFAPRGFLPTSGRLFSLRTHSWQDQGRIWGTTPTSKGKSWWLKPPVPRQGHFPCATWFPRGPAAALRDLLRIPPPLSMFSFHFLCIGFRCTAQWPDNHTFYILCPSIFPVLNWHRTRPLQHY